MDIGLIKVYIHGRNLSLYDGFIYLYNGGGGGSGMHIWSYA